MTILGTGIPVGVWWELLHSAGSTTNDPLSVSRLKTWRRTRYVDPNTGAYVVENGQYKTIPQALGRATNRVLLVGGSVPDAPQFTSRVRSLGRKRRAGITTEIEHEIDACLQPMVPDQLKSYARTCWLEENAIVYSLTVEGVESDTVPVA